MEILLLQILSRKDYYNRFKKFIKDYTLTKESFTILDDIGAWFADTGKDKVDWTNFRTWFLTVKHATFKEDKVIIFNAIFDNIVKAEEPDDKDIGNIIKSFIERDYATRIADHSLRIAEGESLKLVDISDMMKEWEKESGKADELEELVESSNIEDLLNDTLVSGGYNWRLPELNQSLGPLRKGDFIVIGAAPEVGKTTMIASEASFIAQQFTDDRCVLWINNEEGEQKVRVRCIQATLGWTDKDMMSNTKNTLDEYIKVMGGVDRFKIVRANESDVHDIDSMINKYNPGLIILDQLWKVHGFTKEAGHNEVMRQTMLFNQAREWAKRQAPVIAVHQADGTAGGVPYLEMSQLYMSRVGIQGEADAIIMIGSTYDTSVPPNRRYLNIPKNKLSGGPMSDPKYRHYKYEIEIEPEIARYKGFV